MGFAIKYIEDEMNGLNIKFDKNASKKPVKKEDAKGGGRCNTRKKKATKKGTRKKASKKASRKKATKKGTRKKGRKYQIKIEK